MRYRVAPQRSHAGPFLARRALARVCAELGGRERHLGASGPRPRHAPGTAPRPRPSSRLLSCLPACGAWGSLLPAGSVRPLGICALAEESRHPRSSSLGFLRFALVFSSPKGTRAGRVSGVFFRILCPLPQRRTTGGSTAFSDF